MYLLYIDDFIYKAYKETFSEPKIFYSFSSKLFSLTLNVVYSKYTLGAQSVDFVAGTIFIFYEKAHKETQEKIAKRTKAYGKRVYRKDDKIVGIVHVVVLEYSGFVYSGKIFVHDK